MKNPKKLKPAMFARLRQHVWETLIAPLRIVLQVWEKEETRDNENMKQVFVTPMRIGLGCS